MPRATVPLLLPASPAATYTARVMSLIIIGLFLRKAEKPTP